MEPKRQVQLLKEAVTALEAYDTKGLDKAIQQYSESIPTTDDQGYPIDKNHICEQYRAKQWGLLQNKLSRSTGINFSAYLPEYSNEQIKILLLSSIRFEIEKAKGQVKHWYHYITFDRVLLVLTSLGSIIVNIIQAIN